MANLESDAFVFFGDTGDLVSKQIFSALQAMMRHGRLDIPIVGVGRSVENLERIQNMGRHLCRPTSPFRWKSILRTGFVEAWTVTPERSVKTRAKRATSCYSTCS
jgi:glucose-6-phosphate 1-dehydrogenase